LNADRAVPLALCALSLLAAPTAARADGEPPSGRAQQQVDPDPPPHLRGPVPPPSPPSDAPLVVLETVAGTATMVGVAAVGYFIANAAVDQSSGFLAVVALGDLVVGPAVAGSVTCAIGRHSESNEGGCGWAILGAYVGLVAILPMSLVHDGVNPANGQPYVSRWAQAAGYVGGAALGAIVGWNLSKHHRRGAPSLAPIERAGPPPEAMAAWREPLLRSSEQESLAPPVVELPLLAFAF